MNDDTAILSALSDERVPEAGPEDERTDSLAAELAHAAPKRWWNRGTVVLAGLVLVAGGFVGGLQAQKHWGTASGGSAFSGFNGGAAGRSGAGGTGAGRYGGGGTGRAGAGNGAGGFGSGNAGAGPDGAAAGSGNAATGPDGAAAGSAGTTGTVKLVDGSTIYVQTPDGNVVTVKTDGKTAVAAASKTALKNIKAGQTVTVQGPSDADGTVAATSVTAQAK